MNRFRERSTPDSPSPEAVIDLVERQAPEGFTQLADVINPAELEAIVNSYARAAGASREQVN